MDATTQRGVGQDLTSPYREHKLAKKWVEQIFDARKERKRLERFQNCASYLAFEHCHDKSHHHTLDEANFCRDRMCNMCQWRKSLRTWSSIWKATDYLLTSDKKNPQFILLTLTVQNCEVADTGSTLKRMMRAFQSLRRKKFFKDQVRGYFKSLEVTFNEKSNTMHPHFHVLLHVDKSYFKGTNYVKRDVWLNEWRKSYKDFNITQVDIRNLKQKNSEELKKSVCEVAKYAVKPNVFDPSSNPVRKTIALKALKKHLHGVHLQQAGGSIWFALKAVNANMDEETMEFCDDNHIGLDCPVCNEELMKSWYKWQGTEYGLRRMTNIGYLWSRDFKSLASSIEHLTFNQVALGAVDSKSTVCEDAPDSKSGAYKAQDPKSCEAKEPRSSKPCVDQSNENNACSSAWLERRIMNPEVASEGLLWEQDVAGTVAGSNPADPDASIMYGDV